MAKCEDVRARLFRHAEGETDPAEALMVARHLSSCTACRILLARERRLAEFLERDLTDLPVGEEFVEAVMSRLPEEPPARPTRRKRRGLKLAGLLLLASAPTLALSRLGWTPNGAVSLPSLSTPGAESADGALLGFQALLRLAAVALDALGGTHGFAHSLPNAARLLAGAALVGGATLLTFSTALAVAAAGALLRRI